MDKRSREIEYTLRMRPLLKKDALFSDETEMFRSPMEVMPGDMLTIRFRTARNNVDSVCICSGKKRISMHMVETVDGFDYYIARIKTPAEPFNYYFEIRLGKTVCYYCKTGVVRNKPENYLFRVLPGFFTPDWAKGAVFYQIFVDRFRNGDTSNDVLSHEYNYIHQHTKRIDNWYLPPEGMDVGNFYGGDLQGVIDKLDYLHDLGVEALYLNPIFVSASNHKYDIQDYDYVDPHYGRILDQEGELLEIEDEDNTHATRYISRVTDKANLEASNDLFIRLVEEAHGRGMKVILDGVFNHCGSFNKWMDREQIYEGQPGYAPGAFVSKKSPYVSYFEFKNKNSWPYNSTYDGWWGHNTLPKLNYENSSELQEEVFRIARKWVSPPFCADGWRLDVAADLGHSEKFNHKFWNRFRKEVKEANPEALILAEHYGDPGRWLGGDEWDSIMNYDAFMEPVSWFLTGMEKHSDTYREDMLGNADSFRDSMAYNMAAFSMPSLLTAMNELDNHDHSRFLTRTNHRVGRVQTLGSHAAEEGTDKAVLREAVVMQMTWPGAPTLYYGDEAGVVGFTDPDNRRTYPWGMADKDLIIFYKNAIRIHKEHEVFRTGSVKILFRDYNVLVYGRFNRAEQAIIVINNRSKPYELKAQVWTAGIPRTVDHVQMQILLSTNEDGFLTDAAYETVSAGVLQMTLPPESAAILMRK